MRDAHRHLGVLPAYPARPAPAAMVRSVTERVATLLRAAGMTGADQEAGCAACGACGLLSAAGA